MGMRMMSFIPFPPQMIDWASVRASIPEEENYRIWDMYVQEIYLMYLQACVH